jgi:hypothetical protein
MDILEALRVGPVFFEHDPAKVGSLDLPKRRAEPSPLKPQLKSTDPGE